MGGRVSHSVARSGSVEQLLHSRLLSVALVEVLQLNRLVQVIGGTFGYWFPKVFCT
ncbi:MAG: hypothetical protein JWN70_2084 [Planctomycetaceae bacterium]|nr:hypothetical protein [Planctomycetaceae bacterium]